MTLTVYEFTDIEACSGEPLYPASRILAGKALANAYLQIGEDRPIAAFKVHNDDGTTGIHVRIGTAGSGQDAAQTDEFIAANSSKTFYVARKRRTTAGEPTDVLYINAVADT